METAERPPDIFEKTGEEHVTSLIESIDKIIPELEKFCVNAKEDEEKERSSRKSFFTSDEPELPADESNSDSDDASNDEAKLEENPTTSQNEFN